MSQQYPYNPNQPPPVQPRPPKKPMSKEAKTGWIIFASLGAVALIASSLIPDSANDTANATKPSTVVTTADTGPSPDPITTPTNKPAATPTDKPSAPAPRTTPTQPAAAVACADQADRNAPCTIRVGKPFQLGKHLVMAGWKVGSEYGTMTVTGKARNTGDTSSSMFVEMKFLRGDEVLADVTCTTDALEPGQTQAISCFSGDDYTKKYNRVTVEATF